MSESLCLQETCIFQEEIKVAPLENFQWEICLVAKNATKSSVLRQQKHRVAAFQGFLKALSQLFDGPMQCKSSHIQ